MNILFLPHNVSSDMSNRIKYLKLLENVNIHAFTIWRNPMILDEGCTYLPSGLVSKNPFKKLLAYVKYLRILEKELMWADVIHWYWDLNYIPWINIPIEYYLLKKCIKPKFIQWCGSDIRNPDIDKSINKYYRNQFDSGNYEYSFESAKRSYRCQRNFSKLNFIPLVFIGMDHYIIKNLFKLRYRIYYVVDIKKLLVKNPLEKKMNLSIVHAASKTGGKGTEFIKSTLNKLNLVYNFESDIVSNIPKSELLEKIKNCDIYIDQMITGSHGTAAVEAMAMGIPVICYINETILPNYPKEFPIINANIDNLEYILAELINNNAKLKLIGQQSRDYALKYHNDEINASNLLEIYKSVIENF